MNNNSALVIGAGGGLGTEVLNQLIDKHDFDCVHAVSRAAKPDDLPQSIRWHELADHSDQLVAETCQQLTHSKPFSLVICCVGTLHQKGEPALFPEKRIEDIQQSNLQQYFAVNSIIPALWLKHLLRLVVSRDTCHMVFFSARVGSISDNRLGGWYGYRASKAALNMLIKTAQVEYRRRAPNVSLVAYHPGTVDTALSKPFQANVPKGKLFSAEFSVSNLLSLLADLPTTDAPFYLDWQGKHIDW